MYAAPLEMQSSTTGSPADASHGPGANVAHVGGMTGWELDPDWPSSRGVVIDAQKRACSMFDSLSTARQGRQAATSFAACAANNP